MNIGDIVKVFSSISDYDGQTGRIIHVSTHPGVPAPFVVQFGDAISEPFSAAELVSMKPIEPLWRSAPLETVSAPHGASTRVHVYLGRLIASRFLRGERRRMVKPASLWVGYPDPAPTQYGLGKSIEIRKLDFSPCVQCGKLSCSHR